MPEQWDHRWCEKCNKEAWILIKVLVHHASNYSSKEWKKQSWCLKCVTTEGAKIES